MRDLQKSTKGGLGWETTKWDSGDLHPFGDMQIVTIFKRVTKACRGGALYLEVPDPARRW